MNKIFLILIIFTIAYSKNQDDFKVLSSDANNLLLEFSPQFLDKDFKKNKDNVVLPYFINSSDPDYTIHSNYDYRYRTFLISLPNINNNNIRIINTEYIDITYTSLPVKLNAKSENGFSIQNNISVNESHPKNFEIAKFGEIGLIRDNIIGQLKIYPYEYFPETKALRVYTKIIVQVIFNNSNPQNHISNINIPLDFEPDVVNKEFLKLWRIPQNTFAKKTFNSVLSTGNWYKFKITEEAIYKIDFNYLKSKGIDPSTIDPRTIKIYNNSGKVLSENVINNNPDDLVQNPIYVYGENDGKFDEGDYILFYGNGTKGFTYDKNSKVTYHYFNYYSDFNVYFFTYGGANGLRMKELQSLNSPTAYKVNSTMGYVLNHELKKNLIKSGREWYGDYFNNTNTYKVYNNKLNGLIPNSNIKYRIGLVSRAPQTTRFKIEENSSLLGYISIGYVDLYSLYDAYAKKEDITFYGSSNLPENRSVLKLTYEAKTSTSEGYLNFFEIVYPRYLQADNDRFGFFAYDTTGIVEYKISNFSNSDIIGFNVTNFKDIKRINPLAVSGGEYKFQIDEKNDTISRYFISTMNAISGPNEFMKISNQNIHSFTAGAELIIVSPSEFLSEANRLKNYKSTRVKNPISTTVINIDEVYNEFSGGVFDVSALRDFIKYAYNNWTIKPKYVLLFGDGTYDYRNIEGLGKNYIPPIQTIESLVYLDTYPSDDYFVRVSGEDILIDLAIGRLPVQNPTEAKNMVDKIINYETNSDKGNWRNKITFVADDGKAGTSDDWTLHTNQSEWLSNVYTSESYKKDKIYLILYPTVETSLGRRKPDVNKAIVDAINSGSLIINFIGHGNPEVWTHEYVFEKTTTIPQLTNYNHLNFFSAATCDFGNYDNPSNQSSAELLVTKPDGGSIAGLTSSRVVISWDNFELNKIFFGYLLDWRQLDQSAPTIGDAYYNMKQIRTNMNDQKYLLFGDPSIVLLYPSQNIKIDSINKKPNNSVIEVKSLTKTEISGSLSNQQQSPNAEIDLVVYDTKKIIEVAEWNGYKISLDGGIVFKGRSQLVNGKFNINFIIPKDVSYQNNQGKILTYFKDDQIDGIGYSGNIKIVASDSNAIEDKNGPKIDIFLDNKNSLNANLVNQSPLLIVRLEDDNGINTTGTGLGHNIEAILNNEIYNPLDLTNYFQGDLNQGNLKGEVNYKFSNLQTGKYKLKINAWDVFNNPSSSEIEFEVMSDGNLYIKDIYNFPNPFSEFTTFTFQHSYDKAIDVKIKIYTINGRLVHTIERNNILEKFVNIDWDGRDNFGDKLGNGLYLYKVILRSINNEYQKEDIGKFVIIR